MSKFGKIITEIGTDASGRTIRKNQIGMLLLKTDKLIIKPVILHIADQWFRIHIIRPLIFGKRLNELFHLTSYIHVFTIA